MPEHVHLLLGEPNAERPHNTLRVLKGQTSRPLRVSREQFWQSRYYDFYILNQ